MDPYSLLLAFTMVCGFLGALGLLITLMALEWSEEPTMAQQEPVNSYALAKRSKGSTSHHARLR